MIFKDDWTQEDWQSNWLEEPEYNSKKFDKVLTKDITTVVSGIHIEKPTANIQAKQDVFASVFSDSKAKAEISEAVTRIFNSTQYFAISVFLVKKFYEFIPTL